MSETRPEDSSILIASSSIDEPAWLPVARNLGERGYDVIAYEADKVADGRVSLDIRVGREAGLTVNYDGRSVDLDRITAAWYRRPTMFAGEQVDKAKQLSLDVQRKMAQHVLWDTIPEQAWLSSPQRITHAEHKLTQLILARELGFDIPDTVVTNKWEPIDKSLPERIIFKPSYGMLYSDNELKLLYTVPFDNDPARLPIDGNPFPGFWQPYLSKAREWRITVVGDETFDAAIYTDDIAKDDWRRHQLESKVQFRREAFPYEQKSKCFEYLGKLGLKFGAFDFIEDKEGRITFLECNANGQFGWLEDDLGFPISAAIADELVKISQARI